MQTTNQATLLLAHPCHHNCIPTTLSQWQWCDCERVRWLR